MMMLIHVSFLFSGLTRHQGNYGRSLLSSSCVLHIFQFISFF